MEYRLSLSGEKVDHFQLAPFAGIGLIRGEFILREKLASINEASAATALYDYLTKVTHEFSGVPIWYRLIDLWSDEAAAMTGSLLETIEHNPIIGSRGIRRSLRNKPDLALELQIVSEVARHARNLNVLLPFVHDVSQFVEVRHMAMQAGFRGKIGVMLEVPSALLEVETFIRAGASNLLVGLNDLSCLTVGHDRGEEETKLHPAVWTLIGRLKDQLPATVEWGIAGRLSKKIIDRAIKFGAPYLSIHYAEVPGLLGFSEEGYPDLHHVKKIKFLTANAPKRYKK